MRWDIISIMTNNNLIKIAVIADLADKKPTHVLVQNTDLVIIKYQDEVSVLYGRCHHRGALLADGHIEGDNYYAQ